MNEQTTSNRHRILALVGAMLLVAGAVYADDLRIENARLALRGTATATVTFDISWEGSWRHGVFHDAAWVFFKVQADSRTDWEPLRLVADKVLNPTGYRQSEGGTPLESVVPGNDDGFFGMFLRRAKDGNGEASARDVTVIGDFTVNRDATKDGKLRVKAFGIEMVYVPEGPFYLGSAGTDLNRFHRYTGDGQETPPFQVAVAGPIPTGRQEGKLWATGLRPEDGGQIPASFPNGYAAFYGMKRCYITQGEYAAFLNTLSETQAKKRYHAGGHGMAIRRSGEFPNATYSAKAPEDRCPWLSWADCASYAAWAGLRPMTELEYEKAIRGPQDPLRQEAGLSYWGIGFVHWGAIYERPVSAVNAAGLTFAGTHGRGTPALPADWPMDATGAVYRGDYLHGAGIHLLTSGRSDAINVLADRSTHPHPGWRAARSAPAGDTAMAPVSPRKHDPQVPRLSRPFRADGVVDEWGEPALSLDGTDDVFPLYRRFAPFDFYDRRLAPWQGPGDASARVHLGWDSEALCVAAEVSDDRHANTKSGDGITNGDALQMGLVTPTGLHWNLVLALTSSGVALHRYEGEGVTLLETADCAVVRDDEARITRYELRLPLDALGLKPGAQFGLNLVFFDDDGGDENLYWLQLAPGLTNPADAKLYPRFVLAR